MKVILCSVLFISASAFASVCYQPTKPVTRGFPAEICMDSAQISKSVLGTKLEIFGGDLAGSYEGSITASADNGGVYQMTVQKNLVENLEPSCGDAQIVDVVLKVSFADDTVTLSPENIQVRVDEQTTTDFCHSQMDVEEVNYALVPSERAAN